MGRGSERLSLNKALIIIFLSTVLVSGSATMIWLYFQHMKSVRSQDDRFLVTSLIQTGPRKNQLPSEYLMQLMGLSQDQPTNLYAFDVQLARRRLLANPLIKSAVVRRANPDTVYVEYSIRDPIARLGDYPNLGVDQEGVVIPLEPLIFPARLPEFWLGIGVVEREQGIAGLKVPLEKFALAKQLVDLSVSEPQFGLLGLTVHRVDVSQCDAPILGQRELVLVLDLEGSEGMGQDTLRMTPDDIGQSLANYLTLRGSMLLRGVSDISEQSSERVIDLRIQNLAFMHPPISQ